MVNSIAPGESTEVIDPSRVNENEELKVFTLGVFNSANDVWEEIFRTQLNRQYIRPTLVTFTDATVSECGGATDAVGPFYCPADQKMYIDLNFFHQLRTDFGAEGDLAMAYVTAHEIGHHVQKLLGIIDEMNQYRGQISEAEFNKLNVKLELQADFLAGVWVYHAQQMNMIQLEPGDLESAISATTAVGDDTIQIRCLQADDRRPERPDGERRTDPLSDFIETDSGRGIRGDEIGRQGNRILPDRYARSQSTYIS